MWVSFERLTKEAVERSHRPNVVSWEVGHLDRVVRNKPNPLLQVGKERTKFGLKTASTIKWTVMTPYYTLFG